jgi:hypothetical protein
MDSCLISVAIYLVLSVTVLVLKKLADRSRQGMLERKTKDPTGDGYGTSGAWNELDTFIARSQGGHPLQ